MTRTHLALCAFLAAIAAADLSAADYEPAKCRTPLPYAGAPLYPKPVELPPIDFAIRGEPDEATRRRLEQALLHVMQRARASAMTAAVATPDGMWTATRAAGGTSRPLRLYWASVGKVFTATVILQLAEEGKLSLNDPLSRWMPDVPHASLITVDHLLQHTAGLFSANEDLNVRKSGRYHTPEEHIRIAAKHGAMFCPGQRWRYSNTGYTLLGRIIEQVEKVPYHEAVNARIAARLQLATLRALAPQQQPADIAPLAPADGTEPVMAPSWGYAAGNVVASAEDMVRFWHALLTAKLLTRQSTALMFERLHPMFDEGTFYGRGVMLYAFSDPDHGPRTWLGHSGGTPGAKAIVAFSPADRAFVAVALTGDGSAAASARFLLSNLKR